MKAKRLIIWPVTAAIIAVLCVAVPKFSASANILNVLRQSSYAIIPATALTMVIITSGINLSLGGVMSLAGVLGAMMVNQGMPIWLMFALIALIGIACGVINGYLISAMRLPAFICTYTVGQIMAGIAMLICNAKAVRLTTPQLIDLGNMRIGEVPLIIPIALFFAAAAYFLLHRTPFGIRIFALGNNETILRQEGINVVFLQIAVYAISCLFAAMAGILLMARLGSGSPVQGEDYTLTCIAACVIGGVNMAGGYGNIPNTIIGAVVISVLRNVLNLLQVDNNLQSVILGALIISLVGLSAAMRARGKKAMLRY